jgi:alpha-D-xyloside xylohydrolase
MLMRRAFGTLLAIASTLHCSGGSESSRPPPSSSPRTVWLGGGASATLTQSGELTITRGGQTLLATPPDVALFSEATDPTNPNGYHNPEALEGVTLDPIPSSGVSMESPSAGVLHLTAKSARAGVVMLSLALASDSGFYSGLGERYDHVDPRGQIVGMQLELQLANESGTTDRHVPVPWLVSSRGYGIFVKDRSVGAWDVAASDPSVIRSTFDDTTLDVTIVVDPDPLLVVAKLASLTGLARRTPVWALAPMMWRHVDSQSELMSDLGMIRALHIPTTTFWIDDGWQTGLDSFDFEPTKYTSVPDLGQSMAAMGFKWFAWNSPYITAPSTGVPSSLQQLYETASKSHDFVETDSGAIFAAPGPGSADYGMIDFTDESATAFWSGLAAKPVGFGLDGYKLDYGEDLVPDVLGSPLGIKLSDGQTELTARNYPLLYHQAYRDALARTDDGGVLVVRSSSYGGAAVADIVWPGDLDNGFQIAGSIGPSGQHYVGGLPASVVAAETLAVAGFPLYGADTGGYRGGTPTKEALLRWAEHTALSMVLQLGPGEDKYPWLYDAETVSTYAALANLHQSLVPYLASLLVEAETHGTPTIRPLPFAFPEDADATTFADSEYLLGPSLLVAPVVTEGATSRMVHFPPGTWVSWWSRESTDGPSSLAVDAPVGQPPLYVSAGSLLPMLPPGIDTMTAATASGTVTLGSKAGLDAAMGWVRGAATATFLDGSTASVADTKSGVTVTWTPKGTGSVLMLTLDLATRQGTAGPLTSVKATTGQAPEDEATDSDVLAASGSAYHLTENQVALRIKGAAQIVIQ